MIELMSSAIQRRTKASVVTEFRRSQILQAARESFSKHGVGSVTMSQIAKRARMAKGTLYLHYKSKDAILRDALRDGVAGMRNATVPVISESGSVEQALRQFFIATLTFFEESRDFFHFVHADLEPRLRDEVRQEVRVVYADQMTAWRERLQGSYHAPDEAARMIVSLAFGLSGQRVRSWNDHSAASDAEAAAEFALKGLRS